MLLAWNRIYLTSTTLLRVRWKARYFMDCVAPLKPIWILNPLRHFAGSPLSLYLGILCSIKWFRIGALLVFCEKDW